MGEIRTKRGSEDDGGGEEEMALWVKCLVGEEILFDDLAADEELEWEGREHVETKAETSDVY